MQTETVQWISVANSDDGLGNTVATESDPVDVAALVAGRSSSESANAKSPAVIVGLTLYLPGVSAEPSAADLFIVRGERCEVEGKPHRWGASGVEVAVSYTGVSA